MHIGRRLSLFPGLKSRELETHGLISQWYFCFLLKTRGIFGQSLMIHKLTSNSLGSRWTWTHYPPGPVCQVLRLQVYTTKPRMTRGFYNHTSPVFVLCFPPPPKFCFQWQNHNVPFASPCSSHVIVEINNANIITYGMIILCGLWVLGWSCV